MGEEEKVNWVNVIHFLEVSLGLSRRSISKVAFVRNSGAMKRNYLQGVSRVLRLKLGRVLMFAKGWSVGSKYWKLQSDKKGRLQAMLGLVVAVGSMWLRRTNFVS